MFDNALSVLKTTLSQLSEGFPRPISHFNPFLPDSLVTSFKILEAASSLSAVQASKRKSSLPLVALKENGVINGRGDFTFILCFKSLGISSANCLINRFFCSKLSVTTSP